MSGPIYSEFHTSTGENSEVATGKLVDGLNLIILHQVVSGGNKHGKNVTVNINITPFKPIDLKAKAGETVSFSTSGIDSIIGFLELN